MAKSNKSTYPTPKELNQKTWYRFLQVAFWIILALTVIAPFVRKGAIDINQAYLIDATIGVIINGAILLGLRYVILYIAYGSKPSSANPLLERLAAEGKAKEKAEAKAKEKVKKSD